MDEPETKSARPASRTLLTPSLFAPLNIAAYATWLVLVVAQWGDFARPLDAQALAAASAALVFIAAFVVRELAARAAYKRAIQIAMVTLQTIAALANVAWSGSTVGSVLLVIVAAQIAAMTSLRQAIAWIVLCDLALYAVFVFVWHADRAVTLVLLFAGFQAFAVLTVRFALNAEISRDALAAANAQLVATQSLLQESAREGERLRLSRELHDVAGHGLTALKLNLDLAERTPEPERGRRIGIARELAETLMGDVRGVVSQLRRYDGVDISEALAALARHLPGPTIRVDIEDGLRVTTMEQAEAVLRCVQEALTNAARHAHARTVHVRVAHSANSVSVTIEDDGRGSAALALGNGLSGMRERFAQLGGSVDFRTSPGAGFAVHAIIPSP